LCRMILTSPADACANPMHGNIAGRARESASVPRYALRISFSMRRCIVIMDSAALDT